MKKEKTSFLEGKAFYAVLILCLAAIGVSGYYVFFKDKAGSKTITAEKQVVEYRDTLAEEAMARTETEKATAASGESKESETQVAADLQWVAPLNGNVILSFSGNDLVYSETMGDWRTHNGVDLQAEVGSKVCAMTKGVVTDVSEDSLDGVSVTVQHAGGYKAVYKNLEEAVLCKAGDEVQAGDIIGKVGKTMTTESVGQEHLHLEVTKNGSFIDPVTLFSNEQ